MERSAQYYSIAYSIWDDIIAYLDIPKIFVVVCASFGKIELNERQTQPMTDTMDE